MKRTNNIDDSTLEAALKQQGLSMEKYRHMLAQQLTRMKLVEVKVKARVTVSEDDIKARYALMTANVQGQEELKVRDIFLPFGDDTFDFIICSEVMEHIPDDAAAASELARVLKPGGTIAVTVPTWLPEKVCWALNDEYHAPFVDGGHVRIFTAASLRARFRDAGLEPGAVHHAHALHSPYWWLKCAVGPTNDTNPLVRAYHRLLVWDITKAPKLTRWTEKLLNPVLGKSLVLYSSKERTSA